MKSVDRNEIPVEIQEVCSRIKSLRHMLKMSQAEFSSSAGISQGHLCAIERCNQAPSKTLLLALCYRYNVNENWIIGGAGEPFSPTISEQGIPIYRQFPGFSATPEDCTLYGHILVPGLPKDSFALLQRGDFMAPTIQANDIVICDPSFDRIINDDLLLIENRWDTFIIRRYRVTGDTAMFTPDNTLYKPFPMRREMVIAKVMKVLRDVNF